MNKGFRPTRREPTASIDAHAHQPAVRSEAKQLPRRRSGRGLRRGQGACPPGGAWWIAAHYDLPSGRHDRSFIARLVLASFNARFELYVDTTDVIG